MTAPFRRVLIANRGEIALRIIRACRDLGMEAVAVYSDADATAAHVRAADFAVRLGPSAPSESYLRIDLVVGAAVESGADAVHPGYGFLAERAEFARAVEEAGVTFVGPRWQAIAALGDKLAARRAAVSAGVSVVPGTFEPAPIDHADQVDAIVASARAIGFPLMVKAAAGGGGRGMRRVARPEDLPAALVAGSREAAAAFGDGSVYLEREVRPARHVEVQLLGDNAGTVVAIGERDCSIQRRHQKLVEEAPAPGLSRDQRVAVHDLAVRAASASGLTNAATAEFLLDPAGSFWFLEVNARLQVEHGVTELVTGLDLVREQFSLAAGHPLSDVVRAAAGRAADPTRAAIEIRLSAEDPANGFAPAPGRVGQWRMPSGPGVRVDTALEAGDRVPPDYDPLIAKLMVDAADRPTAIARLRRALDEVEVTGIQTTLPFDRALARHPKFAAGELSTDWVADEWDGPAERERAIEAAAVVAAGVSFEVSAGSDVPRPGPTVGAGERSGSEVATPGGDVRRGGWAAVARQEAVDRWPS
jgi:acetyl/propionyl-CoA carboxylase alpha subunit